MKKAAIPPTVEIVGFLAASLVKVLTIIETHMLSYHD